MSDTIYSAPGAVFFSELDNAATGLVGTVGVRLIRKSDEVEVLARTTGGIVESPAGSGRYVFTAPAPADAGDYSVLWDLGTVTPSTVAADDLVVTFDLPGPAAPPGPGYAHVSDVEALNKGRPPFPASSARGESTITDVEGWLAETSGIIDGLLREDGYLVPIPSPTATAAMRTLQNFNALGAAYYVERAAKTSDRLKEARSMWEWALKMLDDGLIALDIPSDTLQQQARSGFGRMGSAATPFFTRDMQL